MSSRGELLQRLYQGIEQRATESRQNSVPPLPISLTPTGDYRFHLASSLAIQSLVRPDDEINLLAIAAMYRERFPRLATRTFWQPAGTFHINVAILRRLSPDPLSAAERSRLLSGAAPVLDWLDEQPAYEIDFPRVLLAADGTLLALGCPRSAIPSSIRQAFAGAGFPDQQAIFHITIGRVLEVLPEPDWRRAVRFRCDRGAGVIRVREAILVDEREGFLHSPACYDVLRRFTLR